MRRRPKSALGGWLYITGSTHRRLPVFAAPRHCEIFLKNLAFYRKKYGFGVMAYALLPDHYHMILALPAGVSLMDLLRDFKSAVGKQIIEALRKERKVRLLERMRLTSPPRRRKDARFKVLQADNYIDQITSDRFFRQKLDYVHANPVRHRLVVREIDYQYSSARWYLEAGSRERTQWQGPLGSTSN